MMKALVKRLEKLERTAPTGALDLDLGFHGNGAPAQRRKGMGAIDPIQLEWLCALGCSDPEIAAWFGVTESVMERCRQRRAFQEAIARGRAKGKIFVRRAQMQMLEKGSPTMALWLGKQTLGQREHLEGTDRPTPLVLVVPDGKGLSVPEAGIIASPADVSQRR